MSITYHNQQFASAGYPPVFVINLRRSAERRESIQDELGRAEVPYALVEAVDGKRMTMDTLAAYNYLKDQRKEIPVHNPAYLKSFLLPGGGRNFRVPKSIVRQDMVRGEIGCFLSHCKIYAHIFQNKIPLSVILEDDVSLSSDFGEVLTNLKNCSGQYEVIFLGSRPKLYASLIEKGGVVSLWGRIKIGRTHQLGHFVALPFGSYGYAISWQGACDLLSFAVPISVFSDRLLILGLRGNRYKVGCIKPETVTIKENLEEFSAIDSIDMRPGWPPPSLLLLLKTSWKTRLKQRWTGLYCLLRACYYFLCGVRNLPKRLRITLLQIFPTWPV